MDQKRFILAVVLSAGVLFAYQMYFVPKPSASASKRKANQSEEAETKAEESEQAETGPKEGTSSPESDEPKSASADTGTGASTDAGTESAGAKAEAQAESTGGSGGEPSVESAESAQRDVDVQSHVLKSGELRVALTNAGTGRLKSIELRKPRQYAKRGDLLGDFPKESAHYPFEISLTENAIPLPEGATFEFAEDESTPRKDGSGYKRLVYRYSDPQGRFQIDKTFTFADAPYAVDMKVTIENSMERPLRDALGVDIFGYKDPDEETSFLNFRPNSVEGVCRMGSEAKRSTITDIEEALEYDGSEVYWGAIDTRYFMTAAIPDQDVESCAIERIDEGFLRTRLHYEEFSVQPGSKETYAHTLFLGPKDVDILSEVGCGPDEKGCSDPHHLSDSINYGLFAFIARPLRWALDYLQGFVINWGLAIILLTIVIKLLTWPINMKAYRSMEGMKEIQPKLEEIRDKYEDDRQRMTEETMKLFRENDVSPMGGCLPMILQMPILYGLYVMIYSSVELYHADFVFWYANLAAPDPYYVLPILMGVVMFVQQGMMSNAGGNMQAKVMTKVMPVMFTAFMLFLPSGLVLYYSVNLIIGLGQQFYIRGFEFGDSDDDSDAS